MMQKNESIHKVLTDDLKLMVDNNLTIQATVVVLIGIEYMGSFFDDEPFQKAGMSEKRFKTGLKKFFPKEYYQQRDYYYNELRASLIHGFALKKSFSTDYLKLIADFRLGYSNFIENKEKLPIPAFKLKTLVN